MKRLKEDNLKHFFAEETLKKYSVVFIIILAVMLICELFIFNFKWVNSAFDKKVDAEMTLSGINESGTDLKFTSDSATIEYKNLNEELKYLYFKPGSNKGGVADITLSAVDEANSSYFSAPSRTVLTDVKSSEYIRLRFSGEVKDFKITVNGMNGKTISKDNIGLNVRVPGLCFPGLDFYYYP